LASSLGGFNPWLFDPVPFVPIAKQDIMAAMHYRDLLMAQKQKKEDGRGQGSKSPSRPHPMTSLPSARSHLLTVPASPPTKPSTWAFGDIGDTH
jgi:hypothetical protein